MLLTCTAPVWDARHAGSSSITSHQSIQGVVNNDPLLTSPLPLSPSFARWKLQCIPSFLLCRTSTVQDTLTYLFNRRTHHSYACIWLFSSASSPSPVKAVIMQCGNALQRGAALQLQHPRLQSRHARSARLEVDCKKQKKPYKVQKSGGPSNGAACLAGWQPPLDGTWSSKW